LEYNLYLLLDLLHVKIILILFLFFNVTIALLFYM